MRNIAFIIKWLLHIYIVFNYNFILTWKIKCSLAVSEPMNKSSCWTYAHLERSSSAPIGIPFKARIADCEIWTPHGDRNARAFSNVVFPAPELPRTANSSPEWATPVTFFKRCFRGTGIFLLWFKQFCILLWILVKTEVFCGASPNISIFVHVYVSFGVAGVLFTDETLP